MRRALGSEGLVSLAQRLGELLQAYNVLTHQTEHRGMQARVREALYLVDVVIGRQLACSRPGKIRKFPDSPKVFARQSVIEQPPRCVARKCRMRLIEDAGADPDLVDAVRDRRVA